MPLKKWIESANYAIEGIIFAARSERHIKYHLFTTLFVLLFSYAVGVTKIEFLLISLASLCVLMAEMLNTSIEAVVDLITSEKHKNAKIAKDVAAGAVFIAAVAALLIGYIILVPHLKILFTQGIIIAKHSEDEIVVLSLIIVVIAVVIIKALTGKGHPLSGGMPSGHAAVSFSFFVSTVIITEDLIISMLFFIAAILISKTRITKRIHTVWEVIIGAVIGSIVTIVLFKLFL